MLQETNSSPVSLWPFSTEIDMCKLHDNSDVTIQNLYIKSFDHLKCDITIHGLLDLSFWMKLKNSEQGEIRGELERFYSLLLCVI